MNFTPVDPAVKEKIITLHLAGQGRNAIDRQLKIEGARVSHGSISNIIHKYEREHEQLLQPASSCNEVIVQPNAILCLPPTPVLKSKEGSQSEYSRSISTPTDINKISPPSLNGVGLAYPINLNPTSNIHRPKPRNGSPLSHLIVEDFTEDNTDSSQIKTKDPKVNINNNEGYLHNQYEQDETSETENETKFWYINKSKPSLRNLTNKSSPTKRRHEDLEEEENTDLGIGCDFLSPRRHQEKELNFLSIQDSDLDEKWESNFWARVMQENQLRRQEIGWILEEKQENTQAQKWIDEQNKNLKSRENILQELESYIPLARQFRSMNVNITVFMPLIDSISQYAAGHNTDLTTATFDITKELQAYRDLDAIQMDIEEARQELSMFGEQKQKVLTVLMDLIDRGVTENQIALLATDNWQQQQSNGNIQQASNNNGYDSNNYSMTDYLRLNLLRGSTIDMLNKITRQ